MRTLTFLIILHLYLIWSLEAFGNERVLQYDWKNADLANANFADVDFYFDGGSISLNFGFEQQKEVILEVVVEKRKFNDFSNQSITLYEWVAPLGLDPREDGGVIPATAEYKLDSQSKEFRELVIILLQNSERHTKSKRHEAAVMYLLAVSAGAQPKVWGAKAAALLKESEWKKIFMPDQ